MRRLFLFATVCLTLAAVSFAQEAPPAGATREELSAMAAALDKAFAGAEPPEAVKMLSAIARGSRMGPGDGWFGPAKTRYTHAWLTSRLGLPENAPVAAEKFTGSPEWFAILDRDRSGAIEPEDFDWSDRSPWVRQAAMVDRLFARIDAERDGRVTAKELTAFFQRASHGLGELKPTDLRDALIPPARPGFSPGDAPSPETLIRGLFRGEIGSLREGPRVDEPAPDFTLRGANDEKPVRLSEGFDGRPTVLVFGNFTCGPFRGMYPAVDEICRNWKDEARFLGVYVREAHPRDGWKMESNEAAGVDVPQPTTIGERRAVAERCRTTLNWSMPLLVDELHDPVGAAYSGMPARLYVIDGQGKVAFQSGRGPFGFRPGEMEQALMMALWEAQKSER